MNLYCSKEFSLEYFIYGNFHNPPLVLIPPGIGNATHFNQLIESLKDKFYIITFNLPGVGKSESETGDLKLLAAQITNLLIELKINDPIILGESYGGSVAIELEKLVKVKKLILFGSGEYFNPFIRYIFKLIFYPATKSKVIRRIYAKLINPMGIFDFTNFSDKQLETINKRWMSVLEYKIDPVASQTEVIYFFGSKDFVVNKKSITSLAIKYKNFSIININCNHFNYKWFYNKKININKHI